MKKLLTAAIALLAAQAALAGVKIENWVTTGGARVFFVEAFPVTDSANGVKIQRAKLRAMAMERIEAE